MMMVDVCKKATSDERVISSVAKVGRWQSSHVDTGALEDDVRVVLDKMGDLGRLSRLRRVMSE